MKFIEKPTKSDAGAVALYFGLKNTFYKVINTLLRPFEIPDIIGV